MSGTNNGGGLPPQKIFSREELDQATSEPTKDPDAVQSVRITSPCHNAPLFAVYSHGSGKLLLQCAWCGSMLTGVMVGTASILHLPGRRIGG